MPDGNGHWHEFVPMKDEVVGDPELRMCGWCLGFPDERRHQAPQGSAKGVNDRDKPLGLLVKCPSCGASVGQRCFNQESHRALASQHRSRQLAQRHQLGV